MEIKRKIDLVNEQKLIRMKKSSKNKPINYNRSEKEQKSKKLAVSKQSWIKKERLDHEYLARKKKKKARNMKLWNCHRSKKQEYLLQKHSLQNLNDF